jgi:large subunit ribosomal protein L15
MDLTSVARNGEKHLGRKRIGRGPGSGLGKTSGRGHKGWGQRSGASRRPGYEGGQMPLYRRVPKRGFTNARFRTDYTIVNVEQLDVFENGATVDLEAVLSHALTNKESPYFKVLGDGELKRSLTVRAQKFSKSAAEKIRAAGGTVNELDEQGRVKEPTPPEPERKKPAPPAPKAPSTGDAEAKAPKEPKPPKEPKAPKKDKKKDDGGKAE